jgi:single-strand DNA-binding protein|nr:MAG TPA: Single strand binding protein [Caudoviricetes sp.]
MNNFCFFTGNLPRDPEVKMTSNGRCMARFTIAANEIIYGQNGGSRQITNWVPITAWGRVAEEAANFHKGDMISVWGKFASSSFQNQTGEKRTFYTITADGVHLIFKKHEDNAPKGDFNQFGNEVPPAEIPPADMPY